MSGVTSKTHIDSNRLIKALEQIAKKEIYVGIPGDTTDRTDGGPPNFLIGYWAEYGTKNAPARPWLIPGVQDAKEPIAAQLGKAAKSALEGSPADVDKALHAAGLTAQASVKNKIVTGEFASLAPSTLANRQARGNDSDKPLIDRGELLQSVSYVIKDK